MMMAIEIVVNSSAIVKVGRNLTARLKTESGSI